MKVVIASVGLLQLLCLTAPALGQINTVRHEIDSFLDGGFWIFVIDFDEDGDADLVAASLRSGLKWYENDGQGNFTRRNITDNFDGAWSIHASDVDDDGDLDVVACSEDLDEVAWWERQGNDFTKRSIDDAVPNPHSVYSADLDNDGDIDVMAAAWESDQIIWWENDGNQNFTRIVLDNNFSSAHSIHAADVDGDEDMDILAGGGGKTALWRNDGEGVFNKQELGSFGAFCVTTHDVDGDGQLDILRNQRNNGDIDWFRNNGGDFSEQNVGPELGETWAIAGGDLDLDGDQDIVAAAFVPDRVVYWLNDGDEDFTQFDLDGLSRPRGISVADFDGDGDMDIATATRGDLVYWYEVPGSPDPQESLSVVAPNGGEVLGAGSEFQVTWTSENVDNVNLEFSIDNGETWTTIAENLSNTGNFSWLVPNVDTEFGLIRVLDSTNPETADVSDAPFTIIQPSISVLSPNGGESWMEGNVEQITWISVGLQAVDIDYSIDNGVTWQPVAGDVVNPGSFSWTVPSASTSTGLVRISDAADGEPSDVSDAAFAIVGSGLTLIVPNGGETWSAGSAQSVSWSSTGDIPSVSIDYTLDNGLNWESVAASIENSGSFDWAIPDINSENVRLRISDAIDGIPADVSDGFFTLIGTSLTLLSPNGGEELLQGQVYNVTWLTNGQINAVDLEYSADNGVTWNTIVLNLPNTGSFNWVVPQAEFTTMLVRISDSLDGSPTDVSDGTFSVTSGNLQLTSPNGGESWMDGEVHDITWTSVGLINTVTLEFSTNAGQTWQTIVSSLANTGSFSWIVPAVTSDNLLVRVSDSADGHPSDQSDGTFSITTSAVTVVSPNGGESWFGSTSQLILWNTVGNVPTVRLEFSSDGGATWNLIADNQANVGSLSWEVPQLSTTSALVRISDTSDGERADVSDGVFGITQSSLSLLTPNGGEVFLAEATSKILWTSVGPIDSVHLEFSADGGGNWLSIAETTENDGQWEWTVPNSGTSSGLVRVSDARVGTPLDQSDGAFSIIASTLTVTMPNGGEEWTSGATELITWHSTGIIENVRLEYSSDDGISWQQIEASTPNDGSFIWTLPAFESDSARVRVADAVDGTPIDESDDRFSVTTVPTDVTVRQESSQIPEQFELFQNYPNPFNIETRIDFAVHKRADVLLAIYNVKGELVRTLHRSELAPGLYSTQWDGKDERGNVITSGLYIYKISMGVFQASRKLIVVK